jgi:hypothetical protein
MELVEYITNMVTVEPEAVAAGRACVVVGILLFQPVPDAPQ